VKALISVNGYAKIDEHLQLVLHNWIYAAQFNQMLQLRVQSWISLTYHRNDFFAYFFSHLVFSKSYLSRVGLQTAIGQLVAANNSITMDGRAFVCKGTIAIVTTI